MTDNSRDYSEFFETVRGAVRQRLDGVHQAREIALPECRRAIRASSLAIRAVHAQRTEAWETNIAEAREALRTAQNALTPFPDVAAAGFLHDAEKEVAEAYLTHAFVFGEPLPTWYEITVRLPAWLNGMAEAASELRRNILDRLRADNPESGERLFAAMEAAYDMLTTVDYPDAITGGLRRTVDSLRAVVERTRADLTTTLVQERLHRALRGAAAGAEPEASSP